MLSCNWCRELRRTWGWSSSHTREEIETKRKSPSIQCIHTPATQTTRTYQMAPKGNARPIVMRKNIIVRSYCTSLSKMVILRHTWATLIGFGENLWHINYYDLSPFDYLFLCYVLISSAAFRFWDQLTKIPKFLQLEKKINGGSPPSHFKNSTTSVHQIV